MFSMFSGFIIPAVLAALIIFIVAGFKAVSMEGGEKMIRNVFIYLVLFATLMMTIGGSVGAFMAIADIVAPTPYYQSFEDFIYRDLYTREGEELKLSEEELKERYDATVNRHIQNQVDRAKNSLIKSFGWIVIPLPVFIYFQRRLAQDDAKI